MKQRRQDIKWTWLTRPFLGTSWVVQIAATEVKVRRLMSANVTGKITDLYGGLGF